MVITSICRGVNNNCSLAIIGIALLFWKVFSKVVIVFLLFCYYLLLENICTIINLILIHWWIFIGSIRNWPCGSGEEDVNVICLGEESSPPLLCQAWLKLAQGLHRINKWKWLCQCQQRKKAHLGLLFRWDTLMPYWIPGPACTLSKTDF